MPDYQKQAPSSPHIAAPLAQFTNVSKTYPGGVAALESIHTGVAAGEFVSILGPSGCGKSTLLRILAQLSSPTSGEVRRNWSSDRGRHPVSFVFQEPTLLPWSNVWRNVYLPLRLQRIDKGAARQRVDDALQLVGLSEFAMAYPRELSGGMKMRVSVARALVTDPQILLLDEPFAALDEITRFQLNDDLRAIWRRKRLTIVFVTHSVFESAYLSTRVLVMSPRPGRIVDDITVELPDSRNEATRTSAPYSVVCRRISEALRAAMGQPAGAES